MRRAVLVVALAGCGDNLAVTVEPHFIAPGALDPAHGPIFEKTVSLPDIVTAAHLRVIGLGDYQLDINGVRVTDGVSNQPWSQYDRRLYWREYDIAPYLHAGDNTIDVSLGGSFWYVADPEPGRWSKPDAMSRFDPDHPWLLAAWGTVEMRDESQVIATDDSWRWRPGPLTNTNILAGEDYDATLETDDDWQRAVAVAAPSAELSPYEGPVLRPHAVVAPTQIVARDPGTASYVFPQNMSAILRWDIEGNAGDHVAFVPSETITDMGDVEQRNLRGARASYEYTLAGGRAVHTAQFFTHGFRYVRVEGAVPEGQLNPMGLPVLHALDQLYVSTAGAPISTFETSSPLYNGIHDLIDWAFASNSSYVLTDCPHREKLGWIETAYLLERSLAYRYDLRSWYAKIEQDLIDAQHPDGAQPTVAPYYLVGNVGMYGESVEWGAAAALLPWELYRQYGDLDQLRASYPAMRAFVDNLAARSPDRIAPAGLGDWFDYGVRPGSSHYTLPELSATASFAMSTRAVIDAATALGNADDVARYSALFDEIRAAFWTRFYDPLTGQLRHMGSLQASHAMALEAGLVPDDQRAAFIDAIVADLDARGYQQTPGDIGHVYFIRALARAGRSDVLHRVYSRTDPGSYGAMLAKGLTTLAETWDASDPYSLDHAMLGHAMEWLYGYVVGIRQTEDSIAWRDLVIGPNPGSLTHAAATITLPPGDVSVDWTMLGGDLTLTVTLPEAAHVVLPAGALAATLDGQPVDPSAPISVAAGRSVVRAVYPQPGSAVRAAQR